MDYAYVSILGSSDRKFYGKHRITPSLPWNQLL